MGNGMALRGGWRAGLAFAGAGLVATLGASAARACDAGPDFCTDDSRIPGALAAKKQDLIRQGYPSADPGIRSQDRRARADGWPPGTRDRAAKGGFEACTPAEKRDHLRRHRPRTISVKRGCELMGLSRSTFYDTPSVPLGQDELLVRIGAICDEFECYGYRRVGAALRHQGIVVNGKKLRRLMREHGLQPKRRRRYMVTTDSNHRRTDLPRPCQGSRPRAPEPALGRGPHLRRHSGQLRLPGCDPGCLVAKGGRLRDQPVHGRPDRRRRAESGDPEPSARPRTAFIIRTAVRNTCRSCIESFCPHMA